MNRKCGGKKKPRGGRRQFMGDTKPGVKKKASKSKDAKREAKILKKAQSRYAADSFRATTSTKRTINPKRAKGGEHSKNKKKK